MITEEQIMSKFSIILIIAAPVFAFGLYLVSKFSGGKSKKLAKKIEDAKTVIGDRIEKANEGVANAKTTVTSSSEVVAEATATITETANASKEAQEKLAENAGFKKRGS
jgi:F0F1-type ATP synthase membrane subunit b/b'